MDILPFLCAAFLLINPILLALFRKVEIPLEKLQFWVMVSTGTAWIISVVYLLLKPDSSLNPVWNAGEELLPSLSFALDSTSAALILAVLGPLFYLTLVEQDSPEQNALLAGLGGVAVLGLCADTAYGLALFWSALEIYNFWIHAWFGEAGGMSRRYFLVMLVRMTTPLVLILLSLVGSNSSSSTGLTDMDPALAPAVILAGLIGFSGWFFDFPARQKGQRRVPPNLIPKWIPGSLGLLIILRGGALMVNSPPLTSLALILIIALLLISSITLLLDLTGPLWFLGCGFLAAGSGLLGMAPGSLVWGAAFMMTGTVLWHQMGRPDRSLIPVILAGLGLLPLPYLPVWGGSEIFNFTLLGIMIAVAVGFYLGGGLISVLKNPPMGLKIGTDWPLLPILGSVIVLLSQLLISLQSGMVGASARLLSHPLTVWLPLLTILLVVILGNWIPLQNRGLPEQILTRTASWLQVLIRWMVGAAERLTVFISELLEGEGGLIWALLIGFLMVTLISIRGGG